MFNTNKSLNIPTPHTCSHACNLHVHISLFELDFFISLAAQAISPEVKLQEEVYNADEEEDDDEAGSFSPELIHGDDTEDAIDPTEDKALLVSNYIC